MQLENQEVDSRRVAHERFLVIVRSRETRVTDMCVESNGYGEFLFVTVANRSGKSFLPDDPPITYTYITFYGGGFHTLWDRVVSDYWGFYDPQHLPCRRSLRISKKQILATIKKRLASLPPHTNEQTAVENLAEQLGSLSDEDGFLNSCDDLGIDLLPYTYSGVPAVFKEK